MFISFSDNVKIKNKTAHVAGSNRLTIHAGQKKMGHTNELGNILKVKTSMLWPYFEKCFFTKH